MVLIALWLHYYRGVFSLLTVLTLNGPHFERNFFGERLRCATAALRFT